MKTPAFPCKPTRAEHKFGIAAAIKVSKLLGMMGCRCYCTAGADIKLLRGGLFIVGGVLVSRAAVLDAMQQ